jgi:hypothetical protein
VGGTRLCLQVAKVFVLYRATSARITAIQVWDGPNKVMEFTNLNLTGDHSDGLDFFNQFSPLVADRLKWGLVAEGSGVDLRSPRLKG